MAMAWLKRTFYPLWIAMLAGFPCRGSMKTMAKNIKGWGAEAKVFDEQIAQKGYKYLGWQLGLHNQDYKRCYELEHMTGEWKDRAVKEKSFSNRGSHHTYWCDECKIYWNIDMSD
jgi:hypothetical protein